MLIKLFDVQNRTVVPTEHCFTLKALKDVMDEYPDEYLKIYQYLFYMTCPNPDMNPLKENFLLKIQQYLLHYNFVKECMKLLHPEPTKECLLC